MARQITILLELILLLSKWFMIQREDYSYHLGYLITSYYENVFLKRMGGVWGDRGFKVVFYGGRKLF
jgi:hypothetical protein